MIIKSCALVLVCDFNPRERKNILGRLDYILGDLSCALVLVCDFNPRERKNILGRLDYILGDLRRS